MKGQTYRSRGRVWCVDSGTVPHPSNVRARMVSGRRWVTRVWCTCCEREVALLRSGCLSHHGPKKR